jgi:ATP-dependent Lhr-like helicase
LVAQHRSTIVFTNARRLAERLTARLNEIAVQRLEILEESPQASRGRMLAIPAQVMAQAGIAYGAPPEMARAHHGSVSREQRLTTEAALKAGTLPAVVATSSLELGIDMGQVDLVVQVESPPSVASGMQRIGRAGHHVGVPSKGVIFPKHRGDLLQAAVVAERMAAGAIEQIHYPRSPLDVLAQHIVSMTAMDEWTVDELATVVRRSAPYADLPDSALIAVLDMLAGRYPSEDFGELRPRIVWDRATGVLKGRPGGRMLASISGGTIPDRGLYGVFTAGNDGRPGTRVGELDEEMVYESRVGDVFALGSSSWRIDRITPDRIIVSPAPGQPAKLPFWNGDPVGRPVELGRAVGAFVRDIAAGQADSARERLRRAGLDELAAENLLAYLKDQKAATGALPDDRTIVVERFRDELGDWRVVVHSPFGARIHAPWALAIAGRLRDRYRSDVQALHADDGIVLRIPDTFGQGAEPPSVDLALFAWEEIESAVIAELSGSTMFASRFRECAARALLLPRRRPGRRTPLWQQRQRSAQLLAIAADYTDFPIVLEAMRECLQDVFDVPGLVALMSDIEARRVSCLSAETPMPSPFTRSLMMSYVATFIYELDQPLAERRAVALSLDSSLLAELLGQPGLRELLDGEVIAEVEAELQYLTSERQVRGIEGAADLLRMLGPLNTAEAAERGVEAAHLTELAASGRAIEVFVAGEPRWAAVEDASRLRDAFGTKLPPHLPAPFSEPVADPLGDLARRYARSHGPFTADDVASRFGTGIAPVRAALERLADAGRIVRGEFLPHGSGTEWCDPEVLRTLRRRCLARARKEAEPVAAQAFVNLLPAWQYLSAPLRGTDGLLRVIEQLQGTPIAASALETSILPSRVIDYYPAMLDELTLSGEVVWSGVGRAGASDGWITLHLSSTAPLTLPSVGPSVGPSVDPSVGQSANPSAGLEDLHSAVLEALTGGALFFRELSTRTGSVDDDGLLACLWDLVWTGLVTNDTLTPVRLLLRHGATRPNRPRVHHGRPGRPRLPTRSGPAMATGRWSALPARSGDETRRAHALAETLLDRYGIVTRGVAQAENVPGGFAALYRILSHFEEAGRCRRGQFVEGLGAAQFALPGAVERLRASNAEPNVEQHLDRRVWVLAATDPANPFGAALPWPARFDAHRPARRGGALVVIVDGDLVLYVERGGRSILTWHEESVRPAVDALANNVRATGGDILVERVDGEAVRATRLADDLLRAGFHPTPRGLRLRA